MTLKKSPKWNEEYILKHWSTSKTIKQIADDTGLSINGVIYIATNKLSLPNKSEAAISGTSKKANNVAGEEDTKWKQKGDNAEYTFNTSERIKTLDDLVSACDIDLVEWEIERWICNKWDVGAKNNKNEIQVTPLYQVKLWLKPKTKIVQAEVLKELIEQVKKYAPKYPIIKRAKKKQDDTLFVIDPCDAHFGKYASEFETGEKYNIEVASKRYVEGFEGLLNKGSFYNHEKIVIIGGNDILHTDNPFHKTTAGTNQDTDGMWHEAYKAAKWANINLIERALTIADVHFIHCPSNHDFMTGFCLADTLQSWFAKNKNITFDVSPNHRKYLNYGLNLIGATHGDGAKEQDLAHCMAVEAKKAWSESEFSYWYVHHIHHKDRKVKDAKKMVQIEKDGKGVHTIQTGMDITAKNKFQVEYMRSISSSDGWHSRNAFQHSFKGMEGFVHHPIYGQINRITHLF